jgi:predicted nucleic acid-binding protein
VRWSQLASAVLVEHQSLAAWVHDVLDAAVPSFTDPDLARWVAAFLSDNRVGLAAGALEAVATRGGSVLTSRGLAEVAEHLHGAGRLLGPAATAYDTVVALEGDHPAGDLVGVAGGVALAALAPALLVGGSAVAVTGTAVLLGIGGTLAAKNAWERIPEPAREEVDQAVADAWDATKEAAVEAATDAWDTAEELADDLGDSLVSWAAR